MGVYIWNRLPSEYQEVEYIGRNGNNYIDTGWIPNINNVFEIDIGYKISTSGQRYGIISNYNDTSGCLSVEVNNGSSVTNNKVRFFYRASSDYNLYSSNTLNTSSFNDIKITSNGSGTIGIDVNGTSTTGTTSGSYANASAYLFIDRQLRWTTFSNNSFISYCKIYESGTLVRNFIPCYRKSDSVIGLYDLVNNQFYTNSGTGTFSKGNDVTMVEMKNAYIGKYEFATKYQEVEYIGTSGTQYIDSGVTIGSSTNNEIIEGKIQFNSNSSAQVNGKNQKKVLFFGTNASNVFYAGIGDNYGNTSLTNDGNAHIFKISQSEYKLYVDNVGYTLTSTAFSGSIYSSNIYIGAASDAYTGTARFHCKENIYYFKIWQGGNLVRNFIPCYRKSDNVIGMYDLVNDVFYTNSGTGTFTKGADVN